MISNNSVSQKVNYKLIVWLLLIFSSVLFVAWVFSNIVIYFLISTIVAAVGRPFTEYFSKYTIFKRSVSRLFAVLFTFIILSSFVTLLIFVFVPLIREQIAFLSFFEFSQLEEMLAPALTSIENFMIKYELTTRKDNGFLIEDVFSGVKGVLKELNYSNLIEEILNFTGSFFIGLTAVFFISFFLLYEKGIIVGLFLKNVPNRYFEIFLSAYYHIQKLLSSYLLGLVLQMLAIFSFSALALILANVEHALTIALFATVSNLIPYVGPLLGTMFGVATSLLTHSIYDSGVNIYFILFKIMLIFLIVQLLDNLLIQPIVFSKSVKAHPLEIFVVVFAGASLMGIVGMIFAIPLYTLLKVSFQEIFRGFQKYRSFRS